MWWRRLWDKFTMKYPTYSCCFISGSTSLPLKHIIVRKKHQKTFFSIVMRHKRNVAYLQVDVYIFTSHFVWRYRIAIKRLTLNQLLDAAEQKTHTHSHKCPQHTDRFPCLLDAGSSYVLRSRKFNRGKWRKRFYGTHLLLGPLAKWQGLSINFIDKPYWYAWDE